MSSDIYPEFQYVSLECLLIFTLSPLFFKFSILSHNPMLPSINAIRELQVMISVWSFLWLLLYCLDSCLLFPCGHGLVSSESFHLRTTSSTTSSVRSSATHGLTRVLLLPKGLRAPSSIRIIRITIIISATLSSLVHVVALVVEHPLSVHGVRCCQKRKNFLENAPSLFKCVTYLAASKSS